MSNQKIVTETALSALASDIKTALSGKANSNDVYPKSQTYNRTEIDNALDLKADKSELYNVYPTEQESGSIAHFTDGADNIPVKSLVSEIVAVESGSGEKSPTNPYTISGFNSGVVTRCGKNLIENKKFQQTAQAVIIGWDAYTNIGKTYLKAGTYTFSADITTQGTLMCKIGADSPVSLAPAFSVGHVTATFTIPTNNYCRFYMYASNGFSVNDITNFMIEQGSQATAYEQYNGNTYTFTFGQTVYGGRFDNKGNLVVTHKFLEFDYQSNWRFENILGGNFYVACGSDVKASQFGDDLSCNCSPSSSILAVTTNTCLISVAKNFNFTWGGTLGITNVDDFKTYLQTNNLVIKVKCLLATPITLSITSQDIPTLLGENNIFSNCGDVEVDYHADIGLYIDKKISSLAQA